MNNMLTQQLAAGILVDGAVMCAINQVYDKGHELIVHLHGMLVHVGDSCFLLLLRLALEAWASRNLQGTLPGCL